MMTQLQRGSGDWTAGYLAVTRNRVLHAVRRSIQMKAFSDFICDSDAKILDVGCGNGIFLKMLSDRGFANLYGVEPNEKLLENLKSSAPELACRVKKGLASNFPFLSNEFDCIYFFNVLHHLQDKEE